MAKKREITYRLEGECWICTSHAINDKGYATCYFEGRQRMVARRMYTVHKGLIPEGMVIRHTCDVRACINPDHLILGTQLDNVQDRVDRGRSAIGQVNARTKLTDLQVVEIFIDDENAWVDLAKRYNVHESVVGQIKKGKTWSHLTKYINV